MKRISIIVIAALALGGGALAVAQEPDQTTKPTGNPNLDPATNPQIDPRVLGDQKAPRPEQDAAEQESPLAADMDAALKATINRAGRTAVAAKAKPLADAESDTCLIADEHQNITVLLTKECVAEVKSTLAKVDQAAEGETEQP